MTPKDRTAQHAQLQTMLDDIRRMMAETQARLARWRGWRGDDPGAGDRDGSVPVREPRPPRHPRRSSAAAVEEP